MARPVRLSPSSSPRLVGAIFSVGLLASILMVWRCQVGGDQFNLLRWGYQLAFEGRLVPYGNPLSTGGNEPGVLTSLLVGLPLMAWADHRAPVVLILALHAVAFIVLDRCVARALGSRARVLFAIFYGLGPWRLFFSAHLWNPNYLYAIGAIHLWTCLAQRARPRLGLSFLHVVALGAAFQLHPSFLILAVSSVLLVWRGLFRPHYLGAGLGAIVVVASLFPWAVAAWNHPEILPGDKGFLGRGLLFGYPLLRGVHYWISYASLSCSGRMIDFDFTPALGARADAILAPAFGVLAQGIARVTIVLSLLANVRLWRRPRRWLRPRTAPPASTRAWFKGYAGWVFLSAVIAFALSPTTVMFWQGLIAMHASVLILVLWLEPMLALRRGDLFRMGVQVQVAMAVVLLLAMGLASPMYRLGGRGAVTLEIPSAHPLVDALGVTETATVKIVER